MDSILLHIKETVGGGSEHSDFDEDLLACINAAILDYRQEGIVEPGFRVTGLGETWSDMIGDKLVDQEAIKQLTQMKVRMLFDTPSSSVADALQKAIDRLEWRLYSDHEIGII